jgi:hypothetical protein
VCHSPDPAVRLELTRNLAALVPEAGLDTGIPVWFSYPSASDFFARNTERFCAEIMAFFKLVFNFFTQLIGLIK